MNKESKSILMQRKVGKLERNRRILKERKQGRSGASLGRDHGITRVRVSQIVKRGIAEKPSASFWGRFSTRLISIYRLLVESGKRG